MKVKTKTTNKYPRIKLTPHNSRYVHDSLEVEIRESGLFLLPLIDDVGNQFFLAWETIRDHIKETLPPDPPQRK